VGSLGISESFIIMAAVSIDHGEGASILGCAYTTMVLAGASSHPSEFSVRMGTSSSSTCTVATSGVKRHVEVRLVSTAITQIVRWIYA
jgi:hypothetical protein